MSGLHRRYIHLYGNKWLCTKPEKMYSDDVDRDGNILFDVRKYPQDYRDVSPPVNLKVRDKGLPYKEDMYNDGLFNGWHEIVISETMPK